MCVPGRWPSQNDLRVQSLPPEHSTPRCNFITCIHPASYLYSTLFFIITAFPTTCPRKMLPLMWFLSLQDRCLRTYKWNLRNHAGNGKLNNFLSFFPTWLSSCLVWCRRQLQLEEEARCQKLASSWCRMGSTRWSRGRGQQMMIACWG